MTEGRQLARCVVLSGVLLWPASAFAYIDPGTGAMVVQTILALVAAVAFYFRNPLVLLKDAKNFLKRLFSRAPRQPAADPNHDGKS